MQINELRFSADEQAIFGVAFDDRHAASVWRWELDAERAAASICAHQGVTITDEDWRRYFSDIPPRSPCAPA